MNGHVCCILGVCCPPGSAAQKKALIDEMKQASVTDAESAADFVLFNFDLAPAGSLNQFKLDVARIVRESKNA